ncbi:MAG: DUF1326 domain-containing protein [Bryobacteraceae bacterium]
MKAVHLFLAISLSLWAQEPESQARLEYIEACSCDLFCPCYFNDHASHQGSGAHMCTFNNVARISRGRHGATNLTGVKVWLSGDLGSDWATKGQAGWLVATFEPSATKEQKDGVMAILTKVYPVKWNSVQMDTSEITWSISPDGKSAHAKLANGKGEVKLTRFAGSDPSRPATLNNVRYFGAVWNSPFTMYHSEHYYKGFGKSYSLKKANGFTISVEHTSDGKRMPAPAKKGD